MGKKNFLIDGVSGAGKTTVATELERRGYQAIHGDRELRYRGNPETGEPLTPPMDPPTPEWLSDHQLWDLNKVKAYIDNKDEEVTFFCGGSRNSDQFIPWLDGVIVLDVDREAMIQRIQQRVTVDPTDFGGKPEEMELILKLHESGEDLPSGDVIRVNSVQPLDELVGEILGLAGITI